MMAEYKETVLQEGRHQAYGTITIRKDLITRTLWLAVNQDNRDVGGKPCKIRKVLEKRILAACPHAKVIIIEEVKPS